MNDQERKIITDIFARLEGTAGQARDAEAERLIADKVKAQPYAPYAMAQALYVQEEAMKSLNQQLDQLKAENEQLHQRGAQGGGGLLSSIFGGGQRDQGQGGFARSAAQPQYAPQQGYPQQGGPWGGGAAQGGYPQQGGPWGGQPQTVPQASGGGFLRGALTTAAGVAGGMVVGNALMNAFSGGHHQALGGFSQSDLASMGGLPGGGDTINNFYGSDSGAQNAGFDQGSFDQGGFDQGGSLQDAGFDPGADFGGDMGGDFGGDDSSWT